MNLCFQITHNVCNVSLVLSIKIHLLYVNEWSYSFVNPVLLRVNSGNSFKLYVYICIVLRTIIHLLYVNVSIYSGWFTTSVTLVLLLGKS
jgi:hypothetical protein